MKKSSFVLRLLVGLLLAALIAIALLPTIVSTDVVKSVVIRKVNTRLPGRVELESLSLGWFSGLEGQGLVYDNRAGGLLAKVSVIKTDRGLLNLLLRWGDLGAVDIMDPAVVFYASAATPAKGSPKPSAAVPSAEPKSPLPTAQKPALPAVYGTLTIANGSLSTGVENDLQRTVVKNINLNLDISSPEKPIAYRFSIESGDTSGRVSGEGTLTLAAGDSLNVQKIDSDSKLLVNNWELEEVFALVATRVAGFPSAKGRMNAGVSLTGSAGAQLKLTGNIAIDKLALSGGHLGSDIPTVRDVSLDLDAVATPNTVSLNRLILRSSLANGEVRGIMANVDQKSFSANADVDLAEVFSQFPATLRVQKGTKISQGRMTIAAALTASPKGLTFDGNARIDKLQGLSAGRKISWNQPVSLKAKGEMGSQGLRLQNLSLRSAFLKVDGQGDRQNLKIDLSADLNVALAELRKFIAIEEWDASGKLKLSLGLEQRSDQLDHVLVNLSADNLGLFRQRQPLLNRQDVRAEFSTDVRRTGAGGYHHFLQPSLRIESGIASGTISAQMVSVDAADPSPSVLGMDLKGHADLQQLSELLKRMDVMSSQVRLAGQSDVDIRANFKDDRLEIQNAQTEVRKLVFRQDAKALEEDLVRLITMGHIDLEKRSLLLAPFELVARAGKVHLPRLTITDWANLPNQLKAKGRADLDLNQLTQAYPDFVQLPENTQLVGKGQFDIEIDLSDSDTQRLNCEGRVSPLELISKTLPTISEKTVTLKTNLSRSPDGRQMTLHHLELMSNALSLKAAGTLQEVGKNRVLALKGTIRPDLRVVSDFLIKRGNTRVTLAGRETTPFEIRMESKGDRWEEPLKNLDFSGAIHIASVDAYGLKLTPNGVPLRIAAAAAETRMQSPLNGGQMDLWPTLDLQQSPPVITLPEDNDLLKNVRIGEGLITDLLAAIHPLFNSAVVPKGVLGLKMKHFRWPLADDALNRTTFAGSLKLNGVQLKSTPLMAGVLTLMGVRDRLLILPDQDLAFEARDGRVELSPLKVDVEGHQLTMHGSFGFDKTLLFVTQVPVTQKMVGKEAFRYLEGATLTVPLSGTAAKPRIDETAVQKVISALIQQALQKNLEKGAQNLLENLLNK